MMNLLYAFILSLFLPVAILSQHHDRDHKKDHKQVESLFIAHVTSELALSPTESQKFWPVYNEYREESDKAKMKSRPDISKITTDEEAKIVLKTVIENDLKRTKLKSKLYSDLEGIISPLQLLKLKSAEHSFKKQMFDKMKRRRGK